MSLPKALKTKDRILQISLQLLMSVANGLSLPIILLQSWALVLNLYYHFRNKHEIIKELMYQYQVETLEMLSLPEDRPLTTNDKINYFQVLSGQLWNYRFIHRDVYHLVESNEDFKRSIRDLQDR